MKKKAELVLWGTVEKAEEEIYLTEMSLKELLEGKPIYEDDGRIVIHPPKTNELGIMKKSTVQLEGIKCQTI